MRIALGLEYDGTAYQGWQRQRTGNGVQARVEAALGKVADDCINVTCAGRTDTGVHASGQVVHFDTASKRTVRGWLLGANSILPDDINVTWAKQVTDEFHARFSATARSYRYIILNRFARSATHRHRAWWVHESLDHDAMHSAAQMLTGRHDFSAFRATGCQASTPIREITSISIDRYDDWIVMGVTANAFLQHMVRNLMGTLVAIGAGSESQQWLSTVLQSRDRQYAGIAAPPHGLSLVNVVYPTEFEIPLSPNTGSGVCHWYF